MKGLNQETTTMKRFLAIALALATALLVPGCGKNFDEGPQQSIRVDDDNAPNARLNLDSVVILDKSVQDARSSRIAVERHGARTSATGTLEAFAVVRNRTDHPQQLEFRTTFFDNDGVPIEGPSGWKRIFFDPNQINGYNEFSTKPNSQHYYIEIREAR